MLYAFLPVHGQEKAAQTNPGNESPEHSSSPVTVTVINQQADKDQAETEKQDSKGYLGTLISANNLPRQYRHIDFAAAVGFDVLST